MASTRQRGFTLVELMVAVAVFALTSVGVTSTLLSNIRANRLSREITEASALAQDKLEELRNMPSAPSGSSDHSGIFDRTWTVAANTPERGMYRVTVTVDWDDPGSRNVRLTTILVK